jgi:hypothetical protein
LPVLRNLKHPINSGEAGASFACWMRLLKRVHWGSVTGELQEAPSGPRMSIFGLLKPNRKNSHEIESLIFAANSRFPARLAPIISIALLPLMLLYIQIMALSRKVFRMFIVPHDENFRQIDK